MGIKTKEQKTTKGDKDMNAKGERTNSNITTQHNIIMILYRGKGLSKSDRGLYAVQTWSYNVFICTIHNA
jgi:hypothetical protein